MDHFEPFPGVCYRIERVCLPALSMYLNSYFLSIDKILELGGGFVVVVAGPFEGVIG